MLVLEATIGPFALSFETLVLQADCFAFPKALRSGTGTKSFRKGKTISFETLVLQADCFAFPKALRTGSATVISCSTLPGESLQSYRFCLFATTCFFSLVSF